MCYNMCYPMIQNICIKPIPHFRFFVLVTSFTEAKIPFAAEDSCQIFFSLLSKHAGFEIFRRNLDVKMMITRTFFWDFRMHLTHFCTQRFLPVNFSLAAILIVTCYGLMPLWLQYQAYSLTMMEWRSGWDHDTSHLRWRRRKL